MGTFLDFDLSLASHVSERRGRSRDSGRVRSSGRDVRGAGAWAGVATLFVCVVVLLTSAAPLLALDPDRAITQYAQSVWTTDDGLPQNSVLAIAQTKDGYIWLGTDDGLVRFDGVRFETFNSTKDSRIRNDRITCLQVDHGGTLWFGTRGGGLYAMRGDEIRPYDTTSGIPHDFVLSLYETRDGELWVGTFGGLARTRDGGRWESYGAREGLQDLVVLSIVEDRNKDIWVGTYSGGLHRFRNGRFEAFTKKDGLPSDSVRGLLEDSRGDMWIATNGGGLCRAVRGESGMSFEGRANLLSPYLYAVVEDRDGNLWVATAGGLNRLSDGRVSAMTTANGLNDNVVRALYEDSEGNLWVGTNVGGVSLFRDGRIIPFTTREGLASDNTTAICEGPSGVMWIGTDGSGLNRLSNGAVTTISEKDGLSSNHVYSLCMDSRDTLWVGTSAGLDLIKGGSHSRLDTSRGLSHSVVNVILEDRSGDGVWVGTAGGGVNHVDRDGRVKVLSRADGLTNDFVYSLAWDASGALWVGTYGGGLCRLHEGRFTSWLPDQYVFSLYVDPDGYVWAGTAHGLNLFRGGEPVLFTVRDGLPSDNIYQVIDDGIGYIWMSTNKGIFRLSRRQLLDRADNRSARLSCTVFDKSDGMRGEECTAGSQPAGCRARDGRLWFSTSRGAVLIDPAKIVLNQREPKVLVERLLVDDRIAAADLMTGVPAGTRRFEFRYNAPSFDAPGRVRFRTKLDGFDGDWIDAGVPAVRAAYYTNLPAGAYTFRVTACNSDGVWNRRGAQISFRVLPRFYQTSWFYGACTLLAGLVVLAGHRLRIRRLRAREVVLRRLVQEQTRNLSARNEELETMNSIVKAINQEHDLERVLDVLVKGALALFPQAQKANFLVHDPAAGHYHVVASTGYDPSVIKSIRLTYDEVIGRYVEAKDVLEDGVRIVRHFEGLPGAEMMSRLPVPRSMLAMTVTVEGRPEGFLILDNMDDPDAFDNSDAIRLRRLREHATTAIIRAGMLRRLAEEKEKAEHALEETQRAKEGLATLNAELRKATELKGELLRIAAHDLRNPLQGISGLAELIQLELASPSEVAAHARSIYSSVGHMIEILAGVLRNEAIESGRLVLSMERVDLGEVAAVVLQRNHTGANAKRQRIVYTAGRNCWVRADADRIAEAMDNIVSNAVKFSPPGATIWITVRRGGSGIRFEVRDQGPGLTEDDKRRLYGQFQRLSARPTGGESSTGLGLSIVKRLVELHHGKTWAESEGEGRGSTFVIELPFAPE